MTTDEALQEIKRLVSANQWRLSSHARDEARNANARVQDVQNALLTATTCAGQPRERWRLTGQDLDGDDLTVVVVIEAEVVVVTVF